MSSGLDIEEIQRNKRIQIIAQNGNDGLHYAEAPEHYDNENGSLYKIAVQRGWNAYQFDAIKRIDRAYKKGKFEQDIEKTHLVLNLMLKNE